MIGSIDEVEQKGRDESEDEAAEEEAA